MSGRSKDDGVPEAVEASATSLRALLKDALEHQGAGRLSEAEDCYRMLRARAPRDPDVLHGQGLLAHQRGRHAEAVEHITAALSLYEQAGAALVTRAAAYSNLGIVWFARNEPDRAVMSFTEAIRLDPRHAAAFYGLGNVQCRQLDFTAAAASYRRVLQLDSGNVEALVNLGEAALSLGQLDLAEQYCKQAIALQSDSVSARLWLCKVYVEQGRIEQALACCEEAVKITESEGVRAGDPDDARCANDALLLMLNYFPQRSPETVYQIHRHYGERFEGPLKPFWPVHANTRDPARRLKIGYVSPDLRGHSVAYFIAPVLARHDKAQVEVYCYYNNTVEDAVTAHLKALSDHWIACKPLDDDQLAERIRADGIDVLVDLAGHTRDNRLLVFARKPAPVQVSYLGYPATTGLTGMDWRLVTATTDPAGSERWHTEKLYRLPRSLWCYRPPAESPPVAGETPARRTGRITFGSMNNIAKVSDAAVTAWSELLKRVAGSQLVMTGLADGAQRRMRERFAAQGIGSERLSLHGRLDGKAFRTLLGDIDIALDTFPYAGTTTTCEALWMGIPVITLIGETSVSRSGYALLTSIGLEALAARDEAAYLTLATGLAQDLKRLDDLRSGMRARLESSPLRDEEGLTRDLEAAYRTMWTDWCRGGEARG